MDDEARQNLELVKQEILERRYPYLVYRVVAGSVVEYEGAYTRQEAELITRRMQEKGGEVRFASKSD